MFNPAKMMPHRSAQHTRKGEKYRGLRDATYPLASPTKSNCQHLHNLNHIERAGTYTFQIGLIFTNVSDTLIFNLRHVQGMATYQTNVGGVLGGRRGSGLVLQRINEEFSTIQVSPREPLTWSATSRYSKTNC